MRSAIIIITIVILINGTVFAQANISASDKEQIINNLEELVRAINTSNKEVIIGLISADNPELKYNIKERIGDDIKYQLDYRPFDKNLEIITQDQVRIKARFAASGMGWDVSGLSTYFIFKKQNDQWFITDTDFHKKLGVDYLLKKLFFWGGIIFIPFFIFWIWMLVDCIRRDFDDKRKWLILLIFFNIVAAFLYFFMAKGLKYMKLYSDEKTLIETRRFLKIAIGFPFKKDGLICKKLFRGLNNIYLTNRRIYAEFLFKIKIFEIPITSISYFKKEKKLGSRIRIGYTENAEEKEVFLIMPEEDIDKWLEELDKLIKLKYTNSNITR